MKLLRLLALLVAVQLALWLGWRALHPDDVGLAAIDQPMPALTLYSPDGQAQPLPTGAWVLHVWATWCPPCRDELPDLLRFAAEAPIPVLAVATDRDWQAVRAFVDDPPSPALRRGDAEAIARGLAVEQLPVTFVIRGDRVVGRLDGARDWRDAALRAAVLDRAR